MTEQRSDGARTGSRHGCLLLIGRLLLTSMKFTEAESHIFLLGHRFSLLSHTVFCGVTDFSAESEENLIRHRKINEALAR